MLWFYIALVSYFLLAIVNLTDKFLIGNVIKSSRAYAFLVCAMGGAAFIAAPWFLRWPGWGLFSFDLATGAIFLLALYFLYEALRRGDASKAVMLVGGLIPVFSSIFSALFLHEFMTPVQLAGALLLLAGIFVIAFMPSRHSFWEKLLASFKKEDDISKSIFFAAAVSAFFYGLYFVASKYAYNNQEFLSGFIWIRLGAFIAAIFLLIDSKARKEIVKIIFPANTLKPKKNNMWLFVFNQALGAASFLLQNYAIALGPVAVINALQGFQYGLMIILGFIMGRFFKVFRADTSLRSISQKILALVLISLGLYLIAAL